MQESDSLIGQIKALMRDGVDYVNSLLTLQQARFTSLALTAVLFIIQIAFACILGLAAFILFNVAIGMALTKLLGNTLYAVSALGGLYFLLALLLSSKALRWLSKLKS